MGEFHFNGRSSGVLMHPTSLWSRHGVGDLGGEAYGFADFLGEAGQGWWQMLPVVPLGRGPGYSPYSSDSAFAGSAWLINLERLVEEGLLEKGDVEAVGGMGKGADFSGAIAYREPRLRKAFEKFAGGKDEGFERFCRANRKWLGDYALFAALKRVYGGKGWDQWDRELRVREPGAMKAAMKEHAGEVRFHQFVQYQFDRQWGALREYCHSRGVGLIGDIPIFVAHDSCDVWANQGLFELDRSGRPTVVTGCPPDAFACDGQMWNHPHYRWKSHRAEGYRWWGDRFAATAERFDGVRIDHFLGFHRAWAIPAAAPNASKGKWVAGPREEIFRAVRKRIGEFPIIAEDLCATPGAAALRDAFEFPGMRVLQFGFGEEMHLPHEYVKRCVAYTGTHDNQTAAGWFEGLEAKGKEKVLTYLGGRPETIHRDMIRAVMTSVADTAIVPMQDWLGLGDEARMNVPGKAEGNWTWRVGEGVLNAELAGEMRRMTEVAGRGKHEIPSTKSEKKPKH